MLEHESGNRMEKVLVICGPTAVGKTEYAIRAALRLSGEIVSADSMQLYRYMDIGSAKPTKEEMAQVPHHLVDFLDPRDPFSVALYQKMAKDAIKDIVSRGKTPVVSGGTGLYISSLIYDMDFSGASGNPVLREELTHLAETEGPAALHRRLQQADPKAAERIHENNIKKVIRAIEVAETTGSGIPDFTESFKPAGDYEYVMVGLCRDREELYDRINRRVDILMDMGLTDEIRYLMRDLGLSEDDISMKGIGYKELIACEKGEYSLEDAVELVKKNTRHYAKRQMTWLRRYPQMQWIDLSECGRSGMQPEEITELILEKFA